MLGFDVDLFRTSVCGGGCHFEPFKYDIRSRTGKQGAGIEVLGKEEGSEESFLVLEAEDWI